VSEPWRYRWSSAKAHVSGEGDGLVKVRPLLERYGGWRKVLSQSRGESVEVLRRHERTGRVLGSERFVAKVVRLIGREVRPGKPGRPRKAMVDT